MSNTQDTVTQRNNRNENNASKNNRKPKLQ